MRKLLAKKPQGDSDINRHKSNQLLESKSEVVLDKIEERAGPASSGSTVNSSDSPRNHTKSENTSLKNLKSVEQP